MVRRMRDRASSELTGPTNAPAPDQFIEEGGRLFQRHQLPRLLGNAEPDQFGLRPLKISVRLTARRLPFLAPQVSNVGNAALIEREAVTLPLDHAFGFELADVGPAAIEV